MGGGARFSVSRVTSFPEAFFIETFFVGTKAPALALSDVGCVGAGGVDGGEMMEVWGWEKDG